MPLLKKFCCCCRLETGTIIYGWIGVMGNIVSFICSIFYFISLQNVLSTNPEFKSILIASLLSSLLGVFIYGVLIYGTMEKKHLFLLPWLVTHAIPSFGIAVMVLIGGIIIFCTEFWQYGFLLYIIGFPIAGLYIYIWFCIQSTYIKLQDDKLQADSSYM